ncbi:MAG: CRISPR-associated endonuclease Cas3'' [Candidatus Firestonebacteria bacterium]
MKDFAHVKKNELGQWETQTIKEHLDETAKKAKEFASEFGNQDWAELVGFWHDMGKYLPDWQKHLSKASGYDEDAHIEGYGWRPNHSTVGAVLAFSRIKNPAIARIIAYIVAGHHAGLPDWSPDNAGGDLINRIYSDPLSGILNKKEFDQINLIEQSQEFINKNLPKSTPLNISQPEDMENRKEFFHLWIRMLFSCLVDADFLNTEIFMESDKNKIALRGNYPTIKTLKERFDRFMENKKDFSEQINKQRNIILDTCRKKAVLSPGFFSLTVPTGGGKTLSSMAFALEHALKYGKQRIIMAIPYTSIIEQTAKVYKYGTDDEEKIIESIKSGNILFGEDSVLEHHSNIDPDKEDNKSRLASENWDVPIIVTTNVQLFESLLAFRTSSCRKLHNIVNSVIILDEAQMLPPEYLEPILSTLRGLVKYFGVTVILCTATQPALCGKIGSGLAVFEGLSNVTEIIDNPEELAKSFKRVKIEPPNFDERMEWPDVAKQLAQYEQVLCIVNTRQDCRDLHALMPKDTIHLSANMCGEERSEIISSVKHKLKNSEPVRVVSTQLVEAGVDIDFPVVYRALAGMDSIAQAAGRCNREGKLNNEGCMGKMVVFQPPKSAPTGLLRKGEDASKSVLRNYPIHDLQPILYTEYFKNFYGYVNNFDKPKFQERLVKESGEFKFQFRTFAQDVRLIDDTVQRSIIVWYQGKGNNSLTFIDYLRNKGPERWIIRKLQRFIVNVPLPVFEKLKRGDYIEDIHGYWVQKATGLYKPGIGLLPDSKDWDSEIFIF